MVVLSNNDGCVIARSEEAKNLGIPMGTPFFKCRDLLERNNGRALSSNYTLYGDMSARVMRTLSQFTPTIEFYSIDEAFLLFTDEQADLNETGKAMRRTVGQWTGIPVSVGLGPTKTLAKIANRVAKKHPEHGGVFDITDHPRSAEILQGMDIGDIWGIGRRYARFLKSRGIYSAFDLKNAPDTFIKKHLTVAGLHTALELRGRSCIDMETAPAPPKSIVCSRSFGRSVTSLSDLKEAVAAYASRGAEKLRRSRATATHVHVFLTTNPFKDDPQYANHVCIPLPVPTAHTPVIITQAHRLLETIFRTGFRYKKVGIMLTGILAPGQRQVHFLDQDAWTRTRQDSLMRTMDRINNRWGRQTVLFAAAGIKQPWQMKQARRSNRFTTSWQELPQARMDARS